MKLKLYIFFILFLCCLSSLFPSGQRIDKYYVVNKSDENIKVTVLYNEVMKQTGVIDYYENGHYLGKIRITGGYARDLINYELPYFSGWINNRSNVFWNYISPIELYPGVRRENINDYIRVPDYEIFQLLLEQFIIRDMENNIIMTLDDISEDSFRIVKNHYAPPLENSREEDIFGLIITREILEEGRERYINHTIE